MGDHDAMMHGFLTIFTFVSAILFPWPLTAIFALASSFIEPLVPLAAGLFIDTLYYTPQAGAWPLFTVWGAIATAVAFFVRSRLVAGIINR